MGDVHAVVQAYPGVPANPGQPSADFAIVRPALRGGTWEALERVLQRAGYYPTGLPKIEAARRIAARMEPDRNRSPSFCCFRDGLRKLSVG